MVGQASFRILLDALEVGSNPFDQQHLLLRFQTHSVPVRHLDADEHADDDDEEVDADCDPVLLADVACDAAQDHGDDVRIAGPSTVSSTSFSSTRLASTLALLMT